MKDYYSKFESNHFYHVYNRTNGNDNLFSEQENYFFFLKQWHKYLSNYVDVWAYCLLPNHFHFLIKSSEPNKDLKGFENLSGLISNQFSRFFNSYAKSFNKAYSRRGSLFQKPFKHVHVDSQEYLITLIHYIHHKPIHHHFTDNFTDWKYSSYSAITGNQPTKVCRDEVLNLFGGKDAFIDFHEQMRDYKQIDHLTIE